MGYKLSKSEKNGTLYFPVTMKHASCILIWNCTWGNVENRDKNVVDIQTLKEGKVDWKC